MAAGAHLQHRGGISGVDQPQRGGQQRVHRRVVAAQPRLVGSLPEQGHDAAPLRRFLDLVDDREVLLRSDREALRHGGQSTGDRQLPGTSLLPAQTVQEHCADAVVPKSPRLARPGVDHEQAFLERGREQLLDRVRRLAGRGLQQGQLRSPAQTRHRLDHLPGPRRHPRDARPEQLGDLGPSQPITSRPVVPLPAVSGWRQHAVALQCVEQLDGAVRVATRVRLDRRHQPRRPRAIRVQHVGDHLDEARFGQVVQRDLSHSALVAPSG